MQEAREIDADGFISDKFNQNLWIYTADCMPIFFADKRKRLVAAIHCGRKGLEKRIIKKLIQIFNKSGSSMDDVLVAIGPSISKSHYLIDKKTLFKFFRNADKKNLIKPYKNSERLIHSGASDAKNQDELINLDLRQFAHIQLTNENIPYGNIDISSLCTYESKHEFHSWRRSKTSSRQWNFICPY